MSGTRKTDDPQTGPRPAGENNGDPGAGEREIGGREGPDPTRYGDWEKAGRCIDF
ncbi:MAG TPA: DUF1674 domain-containing protein [Gammaproteobacteria bacterium]|nr:DUF1674 domain-containing protein [Gammaproteobacteria bacterium]